MRVSVRGWDEVLQSKEDLLERTRTRYVLQGGPMSLLVAFLRMAVSPPPEPGQGAQIDLAGRSEV